MVCLFVLKQNMRTIFVWCCLLAVFIERSTSDMYMHFPPGSNNRLNGNQDNVRNANRLFDSQVICRYIHNFCSRYSKNVFGLQLCNWRRLGEVGKTTPILFSKIIFYLFQNNGKAGYNVGDKLDSNPGDNIQEFRQLPMVIYK